MSALIILCRSQLPPFPRLPACDLLLPCHTLMSMLVHEANVNPLRFPAFNNLREGSFGDWVPAFVKACEGSLGNWCCTPSDGPGFRSGVSDVDRMNVGGRSDRFRICIGRRRSRARMGSARGWVPLVPFESFRRADGKRRTWSRFCFLCRSWLIQNNGIQKNLLLI